MCGIVGIKTRTDYPNVGEIIRMRDILSYRGPDDCGHKVFEQDRVALGHRRLSILDISPAGAQPMSDPSGKLWIVHNGEVYNYVELRTQLASHGYKFQTGTDTEVILAAYDFWGAECVERFNGMFAFALWDNRQKQLLLARDRLGIKPLYYFWDGDRFLFASEIKAILAVLRETPEVDVALIDQYMNFGYVPGAHTLFKGIMRLLPGHFLAIGEDDCRMRKYWDFEFEPGNNDDGRKKLSHYVEELQELFDDAVKLRLRSDVPLGIFLSGGLDSSAVVARLAAGGCERLKTFSVAYDFGNEFDETHYARLVSDRFRTDHHEFVVEPQEFRDIIPEFIWHMDEPVAEAAAISLYHIAKLAKNHVTVVLSGEGSDELFAGYDFYYYMQMIEKYRGVTTTGLRRNVARLWPRAARLNKIRKYLNLSTLPLAQRYRGISTYEESGKRALYNREFRQLTRSPHLEASEFLAGLFAHTDQNDALSRMLYFDTKTWLVDDLLIKADRMTMANSLELRVPFLDHRVVEYAATLPSSCKMNGRTPKYILKKMLSDSLPPEIIHRKKMGFPTPLKRMFEKDLFGYARDILLSTSFTQRGYFNKRAVETLLDRHRQQTEDNHRLIWQLLVLEEWHRTFADVQNLDAAAPVAVQDVS